MSRLLRTRRLSISCLAALAPFALCGGCAGQGAVVPATDAGPGGRSGSGAGHATKRRDHCRKDAGDRETQR
jgi:hypothetical protein